jgi:hypothetical protein
MLKIFHNMHQSQRIGQADSTAEAGLRQAERATSRVADLEDRLDKMVLLNLALWSLLEEKIGLTEEELTARVTEIDLLDGKLDGKLASSPVNCDDCGKVLHKRHRRCMYCGYQLETSGLDSIIP